MLRTPTPAETELIAYNGFNCRCSVIEDEDNFVDGDRCWFRFQTESGVQYEIRDGELWVKLSK